MSSEDDWPLAGIDSHRHGLTARAGIEARGLTGSGADRLPLAMLPSSTTHRFAPSVLDATLGPRLTVH